MRENGRGVVREHSVQAGLQRNEGLREKSISAQFLVLNCYQRPKTACIGHCFQMYLLCTTSMSSKVSITIAHSVCTGPTVDPASYETNVPNNNMN